MTKDTDPTRMILSVAPDVDFDAASRFLEQSHVTITAKLEHLDMILATGTRAQLERLSHHPFFSAVSPDSPVSIAPPDGPVQ